LQQVTAAAAEVVAAAGVMAAAAEVAAAAGVMAARLAVARLMAALAMAVRVAAAEAVGAAAAAVALAFGLEAAGAAPEETTQTAGNGIQPRASGSPSAINGKIRPFANNAPGLVAGQPVGPLQHSVGRKARTA
jgi:hypothetical protein